MEEASDKPMICFHRRSKSKNSKSTRKPPIISFHRRGSNTRHMIQHQQSGRKRMKMTRESKIVLLPEDIIHNQILTRLPTQYLVQFRLVCKSWNSLFSAPDFIKSHLTRQHSCSEEEEDLLIARKQECIDHGICIISRTKAVRVPFVPRISSLFLGSINGLVCVSCLYGRVLKLWNPAIAQVKDISFPSHHDKRCKHLMGGFSWDPVRNDYKVVVVCYDFLTSSPSNILVYSSNSASWTQLVISHDTVLPHGSVLRRRALFGLELTPPSTVVKGIPYWTYSNYLDLPGKMRRRKFFTTFKFVPEYNEFRLLPDLDSRKIRGKHFNIVNIKDCLVGMAYKKCCEDSLVDIYSLDEESPSGVWSKMYTIGPIDLSRPYWGLSQCFKNGGEILIYRHPFHFYDPKTKETKVIESECMSSILQDELQLYA